MAINKIIIAGDLFPVDSNLELFCKGDAKTLFGDTICDLFAAANFRICNLEGALTDGYEKAHKTGPVITTPTQAVSAYKALGFDYCMLANNHITDGGTQGVKETIETLDKVGIGHIGAGMNETDIPHYVILASDGVRICIYNVCETMYNKPSATKAGAWLYDEYVVCKEIESLKSRSDYIIVIYHGGIEKFRYPSPEMKKRFHRMADSGANVILAQHTHCIGCEEYYNDAYLLYGQGDFLFNNFRPSLTETGLIVEIGIDSKGFTIKKHKTKTTEFRVHYDEEQDLNAFEKRSVSLLDDAFVKEQFQQFCYKELRLYLSAFKSLSFSQRVIRKCFPAYFKKWLYHKAFRREDLLFTLHTLRSEQNRETAIMGLEELMETI